MISEYGQFFAVMPLFAVWLVGIVLALVYWRHRPLVSMLSLVAFVILAAVTGVDIVLNRWLPQELLERGMNVEELSRILALKSIVLSSISAVAWVLVLIAIFRRRGTTPNTTTVEYQRGHQPAGE